MITDDELSKVEKDVVIQSLVDDPVKIIIKDLDGKSGSKIRPLEIAEKFIQVIDIKYFLIDPDVSSMSPFDGKKIRLEFYFNHMGLFFESEVIGFSKGYIIPFAESFYRIHKTEEKKSQQFYGTISFKTSDNKKTSIMCVPGKGYELFDLPSLHETPEDSTGVYDMLLADYPHHNAADEEMLFLLSASKYLTDDIELSVEPVEGTFYPLEIIYADDKRIVFGTHNEKNYIGLSRDYDFTLFINLALNSMIKRRINAKVNVEYKFDSAETGSCIYVCSFVDMKMEDRRYLYEHTTGILLG